MLETALKTDVTLSLRNGWKLYTVQSSARQLGHLSLGQPGLRHMEALTDLKDSALLLSHLMRVANSAGTLQASPLEA